jgi:O-antigen/teichoic acid export membrane protein
MTVSVAQPIDSATEPHRGRTRSLLRDGTRTILLNGLTLAANMVTGVIVARGLGPSGRGQITAISMPPQLIGWIFAMGCAQATAYYVARHPEDTARLLSTWLAVLAPVGVLALVAGELEVQIALAHQSEETRRLASVFMLTVITVLLGDLVYGVLLGDHDFLFFNIMRLGQPAATAAFYIILWRVGRFTIPLAILCTFVPGAAGILIAIGRAIQRYGLGRPSWRLARETTWYGIRAHGANLTGIVNGRLDFMILPIFVSASSLGLYAVGSTVSGLVVTVAGAMSIMALPIAARSNDTLAVERVSRMAKATLILAVLCAVVVGLSAAVAVRLVYGAAFSPAVPLILIFLPGSVLYALAVVIQPALFALNRPLTAGAGYAAGAAVMVIGLFLFLPRGGLYAGAAVSSASSAIVAIVSAWTYLRLTGASLRIFLVSGSDIAMVAKLAANIVRNLYVRRMGLVS